MELTRVELITGLNAYVWILALSANIRLGWKRLTVANTLAYNNTDVGFLYNNVYTLKLFCHCNFYCIIVR